MIEAWSELKLVIAKEIGTIDMTLEEYLKRKRESQKRYKQTPHGRAVHLAGQRRWRVNNKDSIKQYTLKYRRRLKRLSAERKRKEKKA